MENLVKNSEIEKVIYEIRGQHVMLDSDLARLYECKKTINQAVKRHLNKFLERYVFQLTKDEYLNLKSQVGTSSIQNQYGAMITFRTWNFNNRQPNVSSFDII